MINNINKKVLDIFKSISKVAGEQFTAVVGGFPRDLVLEIPNDDIDIMTVGSGCDLAEKFAKEVNGQVVLFKNFGTAQVKVGNIEVEFVGARKESYNRDSRNPIVEEGTFEDDRVRRDFCCNSLYLCLNRGRFLEMIDPNNGLEDLKNKIIRTPVDPDITFFDDPLRMLRAIRFAAKLGFTIEDRTFRSIVSNTNKYRLNIISTERITTELNKILLTDNPGYGVELLNKSGILMKLIPELCKLDCTGSPSININHKNIFIHSIKVLNNVASRSNSLGLRWAALLHDIGKDVTKAWSYDKGWTFYNHESAGANMVEDIFYRLHQPKAEMKYVKHLVQLHMRPSFISLSNITDSAVRRLIVDSDGCIDDLMILASSDLTTGNPEKRARLENHYIVLSAMIKDLQERDMIRTFTPVIQGTEIMDFYKLPPSNLIGEIKKEMKESILDGLLENNEESIYNWLELKRAHFLNND